MDGPRPQQSYIIYFFILQEGERGWKRVTLINRILKSKWLLSQENYHQVLSKIYWVFTENCLVLFHMLIIFLFFRSLRIFSVFVFFFAHSIHVVDIIVVVPLVEYTFFLLQLEFPFEWIVSLAATHQNVYIYMYYYRIRSYTT